MLFIAKLCFFIFLGLLVFVSVIDPNIGWDSCLTKDEPLAITSCYEDKANEGDVTSQYKSAERYLGADGVDVDEIKAVYWFRKAANNGHLDAQRRLGNAYSLGVGIKKDIKLAEYWWVRSAEAGHIPTQLILGEKYYEGDVLTKNYMKSAHWYLQAAIQGDQDAQAIIGSFYSAGRGVPKDMVLACAWLDIASKKGGPELIEERDRYARNLSQNERAISFDLSTKWKKGNAITR